MADGATWAIVLRYARFNRGSGRPLTCQAGSTDRTRHSDGKIVYRSVEDAQRAAAAMEQLGKGAQAVYLCPRSRHGHAHTTRKGAPRVADPDRRPEDVPILPMNPGDEECPRCGRPVLRPEGVALDDPQYCFPSCRRNKRKTAKRATSRDMVLPLVRGTVLARVRWSDEFRAAAEKVKTPEEASALVDAEIKRVSTLDVHHS